MKRIFKFIAITLFLFSIQQCTTVEEKSTIKFSEQDPFKETIVKSQFFDINSKIDNVVESESGTLVVLPIGCFTNSNGDIITENVKIELAEALTLQEMLLSNLTTTSNGNLLETDGMIYINFTANGKQLTVNPKTPIHIEIPTLNKKDNMMVYKGIRDEKGNMNWIEPKDLENYLIPIDIDLLDFYPENFENEVIKGLPFRNHKTISKALTDSLYYSMSLSNGSDLTKGFAKTNINEPYYSIDSNDLKEGEIDFIISSMDGVCGIDPASIKVINDKKYENTLIATREFEERLKFIFQTCNKEILEIYTKNIDLNLWELDSTAHSKLKGSSIDSNFLNFYNKRLTKVKNSDTYSKLLKTYYEKQLRKVKKDLQSLKTTALKELKEKNKIAQKISKDYKKILKQREKFRMETYGFDWTESGWINIDRGVNPKNWDSQKLEIIVNDGESYDNVFTYVIYSSIKSLYRLNSTNNKTFYVGNEEQREMLTPKNEQALIVSIATKENKSFFIIERFNTNLTNGFSIDLKETFQEEIDSQLASNDWLPAANSISEDLKFMYKLEQEKRRQEKLKSESIFIKKLWSTAYPCCPRSPIDPTENIGESEWVEFEWE